MHKCSDRVVAASGLAQGTAGGVGGACVQGSRLAGSTRHLFTRPSAAQHGPVVRVEAPHASVVDLSVAEFQKPRAPGALVLVHLEQPLMNGR